MKIFILTLVSSMALNLHALESKVHFLKPNNNETVSSTFDVEFAVDGLQVEKAGVLKEGTGHHHLIIDGKSIPKGVAVPKDETHIHFGDASTKTKITLTPGKHTLTLQFANGTHLSMGPEFSKTINVDVK